MTRVFVLFLFLLFLASLHSTEGELQVNIDKNVEGECKHITAHRITCPSIEQFAIEYANTSNVTIHVSGQIEVAALVLLHNITNLSITGNNSEAKGRLKCRSCLITSSITRHNEYVGLQFVKIHTLRIANVEVIGCGGEHLFRNTTVIRSAIYIHSCSDVTIQNVDIVSSNQTSLHIENTSGNVFLKKVQVQNNVLKEPTTKPKESFAGGIQISFHDSTDSSQYKIIDCHFTNITTPNYTEFDPRLEGDVTDWVGYGLGGGISIIFNDNATEHTILVDSCRFNNIRAPWGAGMHIRFLGSCSQNVVTVTDSIFQNCTARNAGGGLGVGLTQSFNNHVFIKNSMFNYNRAQYGAGSYVFAFYGEAPARDSKFIVFTNCTWEENEAIYSPAVDISPSSFDHLDTGSLPIPIFRDCKFTHNRIVFEATKHSEKVTVGVFVISQFVVRFGGTLHFDRNAYSALLLNSGQAFIEPNTRLTFTSNRGLRGGAISMHSFSSILVSNNCTLEFFNNTASEYGGAIYQYTTETKEFFGGRSCFLEYNAGCETSVNERNISFIFVGNAAPVGGSAIYASSFYSCYYSNRGTLSGHNVTEFLSDIGNFTFDTMERTSQSRAPALGTTGAYVISKNKNNMLTLIPGRRFPLPLSVEDELKQKHQMEYFTLIAQNSSEMQIHNPYTINSTVTIYGYPNSSGKLIAKTQHAYRSIQYTFAVELLPCPPGYYLDTSKLSCRCSASVKEQAFLGITKCNSGNFTAVIQSGYWVGYYNDNETLYTAACPFDFCILRAGEEYSLPNSSSALSSVICRPGRQGVLCVRCGEGQSMYYHSRQLACRDNSKCSYGIILYIVSELIPVFIFFTLVTTFDISFTTGARNGFIFFSQMVTILPHDFTMYGLEPLHYFQSGYNLFYRIFRIDFFSVESLSFCLFKGATSIDILAFKYITVLFALILIIVVVLCMNYCTKCSKLCSATKKKMTATASVIHGLSAFIVVCYAECVRVSFFILRQTTLKGAGGRNGPSVAFYAGIDYLKKEHLPYAIPAIISLGTIAIIPPFMLLIYPSILKVLRLCKLSEHRLVTATLRVTRINSLMPMFDVFQGCFKDNFRFFSGLYFFYRIAILASKSFSESLLQNTIIAEFSLLLILGVHSIVHPYKLMIHNVIDSLLFLDLAVLNGLTAVLLKLPNDSTALLTTILYSQMLLIYAPIAVLLVICMVKLIRAVCNCLRKKVENESEQGFLEYLDDTDRSVSVEMGDYDFRSDYEQCSARESEKSLTQEATYGSN